jgi:hypothetical protein
MKEHTDEWYSNRITKLEEKLNERTLEAQYYQSELAKAHELLGRVIHQYSEHWDTVRLTKNFPTDNPFSARRFDNPRGV